jgi:hypothetical protein
MHKLVNIWFLEQNFHNFFKLNYTFSFHSEVSSYPLLVHLLASFLYYHFMGCYKAINNISFQFCNFNILIDKLA